MYILICKAYIVQWTLYNVRAGNLSVTFLQNFWSIYICVVNTKIKKRNLKRTMKIIFHTKNVDVYKIAFPHSWNPVSDTGFRDDTLSSVSGSVQCTVYGVQCTVWKLWYSQRPSCVLGNLFEKIHTKQKNLL